VAAHLAQQHECVKWGLVEALKPRLGLGEALPS
jgi:hypothetical protein